MTYSVEWMSGGEDWGTLHHADYREAMQEAQAAMRRHRPTGGCATLLWAGRTPGDHEGKICVRVEATPLIMRADGDLAVAGPVRCKVVMLDQEGMI